MEQNRFSVAVEYLQNCFDAQINLSEAEKIVIICTIFLTCYMEILVYLYWYGIQRKRAENHFKDAYKLGKISASIARVNPR